MNLSSKELLHRLGRGDSIAAVCEAAGISENELHLWWEAETARRVPDMAGAQTAPVGGPVTIDRDEWGIPHVSADNDKDLFYGLGLAMAQDRLFQLDYLRRKGSGQLAEILGASALEQDRLVRTVGLRRIAETEWSRIPEETATLVTAFAAGVNAVIDQSADGLPIEFDLLDYQPEPWTPIDCLVIEIEFCWYLTGRFPVIVIPELAKRALGDGPLYRAFLSGEASDECILPPDAYPPNSSERPTDPVGRAIGGPDDGVGSNNWVVDGRFTKEGRPLLASDPHIAFEAVSCWYEVRLCGGSFDVAGMAYVGMPAVIIGSSPHVAWGITNNICSLRDLYQEQTDPNHPGCFLYDGQWEPWLELTETIAVRDADPVEETIRFSRNGPIVDDVLPPPADQTGPVALNWLGAHHGSWLTAMLAMNRATDAAEFRESLRPWHAPTFSMVFADAQGRIGLQISGRIPIRNRPERGYRAGWDPNDQWHGLIPFEQMPGILDPERGWIATANNPLATDDYPYPLASTSGSGHRARRIRQMLEDRPESGFSREDFARMQQDTLSLRASECVPPLVEILEAALSSNGLNSSSAERLRTATDLLRRWNCRIEADRPEPALFNVFFSRWTEVVTAERFDGDTAALLGTGINGLAAELLRNDAVGWFAGGDRTEQIANTFNRTLQELADRLGSDIVAWRWGELHRLPLRHILSSRGDLGRFLDVPGRDVDGDITTVGNTSSGDDWLATIGGGYRMIAEPGASPTGLWAVDLQSESGHAGSAHYSDQYPQWIAGQHHFLPLNAECAPETLSHHLTLRPDSRTDKPPLK